MSGTPRFIIQVLVVSFLLSNPIYSDDSPEVPHPRVAGNPVDAKVEANQFAGIYSFSSLFLSEHTQDYVFNVRLEKDFSDDDTKNNYGIYGIVYDSTGAIIGFESDIRVTMYEFADHSYAQKSFPKGTIFRGRFSATRWDATDFQRIEFVPAAIEPTGGRNGGRESGEVVNPLGGLE